MGMLVHKGIRNFLVVATFIALPQAVLSQDSLKLRVDSVLRTLKEKPYEEKKDAYHFINSIILKDRTNAESLFEYALSKDSTDLGRMVMYKRYSQKISQQGMTDNALQIKLLGLELAEKLKDEESIIIYHISIANTYLYQNLPDKALQHLNIAQPLAEKKENRDLLWNIYYNKGLLRNTLGDIEGNTNYYRRMWEVSKDFENSPNKRFVLYILVDHFSQIDEPIELARFTEILATSYEDIYPNTPVGHMPIKRIFEKRADPSNLPRLKEAIKISDSLNSMNSLAFTTIALADTYSKMKEPKLAIPYLDRAIYKLNSVQKPQLLLHLLTKTAQLQAEDLDYKGAFESKILEARLRDSVNSEQMQRNVAELEVKFDTEKKEREIAEQKLIIEKESRQKMQIFISSVALGTLLILSILFFRKRLNYQKTIATQTEAIQKQKITELQQSNKLLALNSMIEGQEAERLRIAKDLHDSLGGLLSTVKTHFSIIQKEITQLEQLNITAKTNELIDEACLEVRRISHNMMPHALSISGLEEAVHDMVDRLKDQGYDASFEANNLSKLETTQDVMVYRILQEIISNIRKHAKAKHIFVQLFGHKDEITLIVEDDGKGFDYKKAITEGGLGLKSINSRVAYLDGTIDWDTQLGRGTNININIPIS